MEPTTIYLPEYHAPDGVTFTPYVERISDTNDLWVPRLLVRCNDCIGQGQMVRNLIGLISVGQVGALMALQGRMTLLRDSYEQGIHRRPDDDDDDNRTGGVRVPVLN